MATTEASARTDYRLGFTSQDEETSVDRLPVTGQLPAWLTGSLVRVTPALLKLFFGADPAGLAEAQLPANRARLAEYERIRDEMSADVPPGPRQALELGMRVERETIAFWEELAEDG